MRGTASQTDLILRAQEGDAAALRRVFDATYQDLRDVARVRLSRGGRALNAESAGENEILRVHEALEELARHDARMVQVVEMRYFTGLSETEVAAALGVTDRTVRRDWEKARLLLARALEQ